MLDRELAAIESGGAEGLIRELELWRGSLTVRPEDFETHTVGSRFCTSRDAEPSRVMDWRAYRAVRDCAGIGSQRMLS